MSQPKRRVGKMDRENRLALLLQEGEGLHVEFKEGTGSLDKEIVAFANTSGGSIFVGINDAGQIVGVDINNGLKSQIQDIAHNCDPGIRVQLLDYPKEKIIEVQVEEGHDKPYRCKDGFYLRNGPSSVKLKRNELLDFIVTSDVLRFDEAINKKFKFPNDFSKDKLDAYLQVCGMKLNAQVTDILVSLGVAQEQTDILHLTNAGVLFFANNPQHFFPESYITAVSYKTSDKFSIIDQKEFKGTLLDQLNDAMNFVVKHMNMTIEIGKQSAAPLAKRAEIYDYPLVAIREAITNAVTHRDYYYDGTHIYIHMYPDRIEIENPGGLLRGITLAQITERSVRRNRLIADLLYRAGYIEKIGSGFARIQNALKTNNNPPYEISASNFFHLRFWKRIAEVSAAQLTRRQHTLLNHIKETNIITKQQASSLLTVSDDTALRELHVLLKLKLIVKEGVGKATCYKLAQIS